MFFMAGLYDNAVRPIAWIIRHGRKDLDVPPIPFFAHSFGKPVTNFCGNWACSPMNVAGVAVVGRAKVGKVDDTFAHG